MKLADILNKSGVKVPFTQVPTELIQGWPGLSSGAKWLWSYLLSRPEGWHPHVEEIVQHVTDGRHRVLRAIRELEESGWLQRTQGHGDGGKMLAVEWRLKIPSPVVENQHAAETRTDKGDFGCDHQKTQQNQVSQPRVEKPVTGKPVTGFPPSYKEKKYKERSKTRARELLQHVRCFLRGVPHADFVTSCIQAADRLDCSDEVLRAVLQQRSGLSPAQIEEAITDAADCRAGARTAEGAGGSNNGIW